MLLDIGLPDASGIDLASALAGLRPAPDIIAITSERDLEMVRAAVGHGALAYLLKPFTFAAFRDRLERYRRYRDALPAGTDAASQAEVDRALAELRSAADRSARPRARRRRTNDEIARAVRDSADGITADEVAKQVGVSRVTAWRYLERLADEGTVTPTDGLRQGGPAEDPLPVALSAGLRTWLASRHVHNLRTSKEVLVKMFVLCDRSPLISVPAQVVTDASRGPVRYA